MIQQWLIDWIDTGGMPDDGLSREFERLGFADGRAAVRIFTRLAETAHQRETVAVIVPHLFASLGTAGGPDRVLATFERFLHHAAAGANGLDMYQFLAEHPRAVETLVKLFSGSQFLAEILLRSPAYFTDLTDLRKLAVPKSREVLRAAARAAADPALSPPDRYDALRRFQRRELLRIGTCDLLDLFDLPTATRQLSNLADSLIQVALEIASAEVGADSVRSTGGTLPFAVIGMGKLGGRELNYSSDIDLLLVCQDPSAAATRLGERLVDGLARVTTEGFLYRVDMRLRPWGRVGPLVSSPDAFLSYLSKHALLWEKQALLKARVIAGDRAAGEDFLLRSRPLQFGGAVEAVRADVFAMKQQTEAFIQAKGRGAADVKLGEGSIRDVEFTVQFLQLTNGENFPRILSPNTLESLARCRAAGLITLSEARVLSQGYIFLRTIEHHLQMMDYRQTHTLPDDPAAVESLARRLGFEGAQAGEKFLARFRQHSAAIRQIYLRTVGSVEMKKPDISRSADGLFTASDQDVSRHQERMSPSYAERFRPEEIARHAALAGQLGADRLAMVDAHPAGGADWDVTIVAVDFPGELSLICGLLFVYGLDIHKGDVFTYEPGDERATAGDSRRKIVDVFTVRQASGSRARLGNTTAPSQVLWMEYARDLEGLLQMIAAGQRREARGLLAKRVGTSLFAAQQAGRTNVSIDHDEPAPIPPPADAASLLYPVAIEIDNDLSEQYTVLRINTPDTVGFLYEFTNALAIYRIYIARMVIDTVGSQVSDILYVTDENGRKITDPERLRELRAATVLIKHFTHLLPLSPNPESALLHFREFIAQLFKRPNWPDELSSLERPEVLHALARLLGVSDFLWDDFLRMQYTNLYPVVTGVDALETVKLKEALEEELREEIGAARQPGRLGEEGQKQAAAWQDALNAFKDREMFRIDMRHILGHTREFWDFAAELSDLAETVVGAAFENCYADLREVYGQPVLDDGHPSTMSVCALGKCGGRELGFASDIELMFVYEGGGRTNGAQAISGAEFWEKLVEHFVRAIRARREGIFEIDLQLRPYGKAGSLAVSLDSFRKYYAPNGPAWAYERQALVKLRPVAGDFPLGERIAKLRDQYVYTGEPFDTTAMRAMRERQVRHLVTGGMFNLKYSPGGLVDVEYLVQALQIAHGHEMSELRCQNTREAMAALSAAGILSQDDYSRLRKAHTFLRWLIDSLRVVRGNARDITVPPEGSDEYAFLARRMLYGADTDRLRDEIIRYTADVQEINTRLLS